MTQSLHIVNAIVQFRPLLPSDQGGLKVSMALASP